MDRSVLARKPMTELKDIASHLNMRGYQKLRKAELIDAIISSGSGEETGGDGVAEGGQQQLVAPDADGGGEESSRSREAADAEAAREESARKVLPPGARQDQETTEGEGERSGASRTRERPREGARTRVRGGGGGGGGGGADGGDQQSPDQDTRSRGGRGAQPDTSNGTPGRDDVAGSRDADSASPVTEGRGRQDGDDDDTRADDDESQGDRKRRNRRERRKRNRDRQGEESTDSQPAPPPSGNEPGEVRAGVLDILPEGYGFLRTTGYLPGDRDVYVSQGQIRKHGLRRGDVVQGPIRQQRNNEKVPALHHVQRVNGDELEDGQVAERADFDDLTAIHTDERLPLTQPEASLSARMIDLIAPLGRGQRALVIAPPRSGKTALLRELGQALAAVSPDSHLMAVMIDERPEEISEMARAIPGEIIASTFDKAAEDHTQIAELAFERARRLVELGHDVIVLLDSVTRLARAYGVTVQSAGRSIGPGVDAAALYPVKRAFAAARNTEEGGSLTLLATALSETGSPADQVILEEFSRVANTLVTLDPSLVRSRVHPPIAVLESGTDNESALQDPDDLVIIKSVRRALDGMSAEAAGELLLDTLAQTETNDQLLAHIRESSL